MSAIEVEVLAQIATALRIELSSIARDALLDDELGADSLDSVALVMAIEERFAIDMPDEDVAELRTVQQLIEYVELAVALKEPASVGTQSAIVRVGRGGRSQHL